MYQLIKFPPHEDFRCFCATEWRLSKRVCGAHRTKHTHTHKSTPQCASARRHNNATHAAAVLPMRACLRCSRGGGEAPSSRVANQSKAKQNKGQKQASNKKWRVHLCFVELALGGQRAAGAGAAPSTARAHTPPPTAGRTDQRKAKGQHSAAWRKKERGPLPHAHVREANLGIMTHNETNRGLEPADDQGCACRGWWGGQDEHHDTICQVGVLGKL